MSADTKAEVPEAPYVLADSLRIREVPVNILGNAVKFTEDVQASPDAGMNGHLAKPIVIQEVIGTIARQVHK